MNMTIIYIILYSNQWTVKCWIWFYVSLRKWNRHHNDIGHFITYKNGDDFFCDLGSGEYSKQYFGKERYTFYHCGSQGHSVPIIEGQLQLAGKDYKATNVVVDESGIKMDISKAYSVDNLKSLERDFKFDKENAIVTMKDTFEFTEKPSSVVERFVSLKNPTISDEKITLSSDAGEMSLYFEPGKFNVSCEKIEVGNHRGHLFPVYLIDLNVTNLEPNMTFNFIIK